MVWKSMCGIEEGGTSLIYSHREKSLSLAFPIYGVTKEGSGLVLLCTVVGTPLPNNRRGQHPSRMLNL